MQHTAEPGQQGGSASLTVMALFKNEADILWEWASHYLHQGASQLILINNNSSDDWRGALGPLGLDPRIVCLNDSRIHSQERIYNDLRRSGLIEGHWLLVCDLDEFVYARPPFATIPGFLDQLTGDVSAVAIPWKLFGSSGHTRHPDGRSIDNFLRRQQAGEPVLIKTISRMTALEHLWVHHSRLRGGRCIRSDGTPGEQEPAGWLASTESQLAQEALHLNHYAVRSREFFERVKATRGNAYSKHHEADREAVNGYFERFDHNTILDAELSQLTTHWAPQPPVTSWFSAERPTPVPGPRAPLFQLLHTAPCLHRAPGEPAAPALAQWAAPDGATGEAAIGIQAGELPKPPGEVTDVLPVLGSTLSLPMDQRLPLVLQGKPMRPQTRQALTAWLDLLGNRHPLRLCEQLPDGLYLLQISHSQQCDAWRALAQRLAHHPRVKRRVAMAQASPVGAIMLVACKSRTPQQKRMNQLLRRASQELQLPLIKLWKLPPLEQLQLFLSYLWLVGPYQPALQLVHALGSEDSHCGQVVILCPRQQNKTVLASMELVEAIPHRLLLLPKPGPGDGQWQALQDALDWMGQHHHSSA